MDLKFKDNSQLRLSPFTQLEYIESTGTQYIDTGISAPNGFKIEIEYQYTEIESSYRILVGSINSSSPYCRNMIGKDQQGRFFIGNKTGDWGGSGVSTNKTKLIASTVDASTITIDDSTIAMQRIGSYSDTIQSAFNLYVFGNNSANSLSQSTKIKLFYLKIYDYQDNIVKEFIPAKDSSDVVCLYDTVSQTFFYNQGAGNFIAGPVGTLTVSTLPNSVFLKTTTLYHENTPNVNGLTLLNSILNYQKSHQDEVKEYYYPTTQLWQDIITEYPDIVQYYNMNHKLCIPIYESDEPEQFVEDFLQAIEDYPDITDVIINNPEVVHSLVDTGYETVLTSSGTQYIDTGFKPNQDTRVILEFNDLNQSLAFLFGSRISGNNAEFGYLNGTTVGQGARYGTQERTLAITHNVKLTLDANKTNWSLSNGSVATFDSTTFQNTLNCLLFGHNNGGAIYCVSIRVYSCKIYDNNTFIRWLVPIQNNGNPCMIDMLTGTKYLNQGTGNFTYSLEPKNA